MVLLVLVLVSRAGAGLDAGAVAGVGVTVVAIAGVPCVGAADACSLVSLCCRKADKLLSRDQRQPERN